MQHSLLNLSLGSTLIISSLTALSAEITLPTTPTLNKEVIADQKVRTLNNQRFVFTKYLDDQGNSRTEIRDANNKIIAEKELPKVVEPVVDPKLSAWLKTIAQNGLWQTPIQVDIALNQANDESALNPEEGEVETAQGQFISSTLNGRKLNATELTNYTEAEAKKVLAQQTNLAAQRNKRLAEWAKAYGLTNLAGLKESLTQNSTGLTLTLSAEQLNKLIQAKDPFIVGFEPAEKYQDAINEAMADTNITNWALPFKNTRGNGIGLYMTEDGCAANNRITNYQLLAGSETDHSRNVSGIIRAVAPEAYLYCRGGAVLPQSTDLDGVDGHAPIYIVNRSNTGNDSTNYNTRDRDWDNYSYDNQIAMFISAGNEGNGTGNVMSPAKGLNMTTVGNYNDANDTISSSSSFVNPKTGNAKPELSAPGVNITAGGFTKSGTSMSSPHAAAFLADMMSSSSYLKYRPYLAKAKMLAGATDTINGGFDKVGVGGIDFLSTQYNGHWYWWSGNNSQWSQFDRNDGSSDNYVTRKINLTANGNAVRVALAWMNRGSYTYDHRNDAHAIGLDLDLQVFDPSGKLIGSSLSWDNPFEAINFKPSKTGTYTIKIKRYANRDTRSYLKMGLYVNYYQP